MTGNEKRRGERKLFSPVKRSLRPAVVYRDHILFGWRVWRWRSRCLIGRAKKLLSEFKRLKIRNENYDLNGEITFTGSVGVPKGGGWGEGRDVFLLSKGF